jgi:hypothetical protein
MIRVFEIMYVEKFITKTVLVTGYSEIVETNNWINQNPDKDFIQIALYK